VIRAALAMSLIVGLTLAPGCASKRRAIGPPDRSPSEIAESTRMARELAFKGQAAADKGKIDEAIDYYKHAVQYDREMGHVWNNLGVLYMQQGRNPEAMEAFNIAADLWTTDPRPLANIGKIWIDLGYARLAMDAYEDALLRDPNDLASLRGGIRAAQLLDIANEEVSTWIKTAIFIERDEKWAMYFQEQRSRVDGRIESERRAGR